MTNNTRIVSAIGAVFLLAAVALALFANSSHRDRSHSPDVSAGGAAMVSQGAPVAAGKLATNFTLKDLNGHTVSLNALRGKIVFLNVWATWCPPCREEMPSIESLYQKFRDDHDFVVLAVSQDTDGRKAVAPYVESNNFDFTVLLDPKNEVGDAYDVSGIPETFIIDRAGRIVAHHVGPYDWANPEIRDALQELINSKQG